MKALRYAVFLILLLALVILVAVPYGMGWWIENHYKAWVDQANQQSSAVELSVADYHRGWFRSTAILKADVKDDALRQQVSNSQHPAKLPFDINIVVDHGLFVRTKSPVGSRRWVMAKAVVNGKVVRDQANVSAVLVLDLSNSITSQVMIHQLSLPLQGGTFSVKDASIHSQFFLDGSHGMSDATIPSMVFELGDADNNMSLELSHVSTANDFRKENYIVFGKRSVSADKMIIKNGKQVVQASGWLISSEVIPQGDTTDIMIHMAMKSYKEDKQTSGPLSLDFSLKQMNTQALGDFMKDVEDNQIQSLQANHMVFPLLGVLKHGVDGHLTLSYQSPYGPLSAKGFVSMPDSKDKSILSLITLLKGQLNVSFPDRWLQNTLSWIVNRANINQHQPVAGRTPASLQAEQAIQQLVDQKMLIKEDGQLSLKATIKAGKVLINGYAPNFTALNQPTSTADPVAQQKSSSPSQVDSSVVTSP